MEKIKLNNQIVSMRKYVKQAKVHVINKLVKQIKFLQNRKGNETQVQKAKRKAERFLEAVTIIKKIKPDDVSKLALSKAKDWKDVLQQKNSPIHDRCTAMLATYSAVQKEVEAFYNANKELVLKITDYMAQWERKYKLPKDSPNAIKLSAMEKSNEVEEANLKSADALNNNTNKPKAISKIKSNAHKISNRNENVDLESEKSDNEEKLATIQKSNHRNPVKSTNECDDISSDENDSVEAEESGNNGEESESDENSEQEEEINDNSTKLSSMTKSNKVKEVDVKSANAFNNNRNKTRAIAKIKSNAHKSNTAFKVTHSNENVNLESEKSNNTTENEEELATVQKSNHRNPIKITNEGDAISSDENDSVEAEESDNNGEESESDEDSEQEDEINDNSSGNNNKVEDSGDEENNSNKTYKSKSQSDSLPKIRNAKNKLKEIAFINLNELEGLDEIPVSNSIENDTSDEKESSEDEMSEVLQNKNSDPFFLGHNNEDINPKELDDPFNDFRTKDTTHSPQKREDFLHRKDDQFNPKRKFQKSPYNHNVSKRFKGGESGENSFKKDKFGSRNYHNKFQEKNSHNNRRDFKPMNKPFPPRDTHDKKQFKNDSKSYGKKEDGISMKNKVPYKKGSTNESLHPSWEAKRKQKELLGTSFQGKRMLFDD